MNIFRIKRNVANSNAPAGSDISNGELAVNEQTDLLYYKKADNTVVALNAGGGGGATTLTSAISVLGVTQGAYSTGEVIPVGTSIETILLNMLQTEVPPTYTQPTLSISSGGVFGTYEIGSVINYTITPTFSRNDAGGNIKYSLYQTGVAQPVLTAADPTDFSDTGRVLSADLSYYATMQYASGAIEYTNLGNPYPTGVVAAGTKTSNTVTCHAHRKTFYGTATGILSTSDTIRSLTGTRLGDTNNSSFSAIIPSGTERFILAYPKSLGLLSQVIYSEQNTDVADTLSSIEVDVTGANGYTAATYYVYYTTNKIPFVSKCTYVITI